MKRFFAFLAAVITALTASVCAYADTDSVSAKAAILYEPNTGTVLYEKDADSRRLIASTTKIMTALVVLENCDLQEKVEIKSSSAGIEGSTMYLKAGERYTVEQLLYGMMLASGNDAAAALACHVSGSIESFAELMNDKCRELSLENTHFANPHGLDAEEHYSSARDLAYLTAEAMKNEEFRKIFSTRSYTVKNITFTNHNKLLTSCDGCIGGKTGYTDAAGRILVSCARRGETELICVTISDPDDWNDHRRLYDNAFEKYRFIPALDERHSRIEVISGMSEYVTLAPETAGVLANADSEVHTEVFLPAFVFAPVRAGERAGEVRITVDGMCTVIPVDYAQTVLINGTIPLTPWERFKRAWYLSCRYGVYYPEN